MAYTHEFSSALFARVQKHAVPLVDTIEDVIKRALDALEAGGETAANPNSQAAGSTALRSFNPATAPDLTHTTLLSTALNETVKAGGVSWNSLLHAVISEAGKKGIKGAELMKLMEVPAALGHHDHYSYTYVESAGISVQGQSANRAWKQIHKISSSAGLTVEVKWVWQTKDKAHMPGVHGTMTVSHTAD